MISSVRSTPPLRPWFATRFPWPWFHGGRRKDAIGSGTPQRALGPNAGLLGFDPTCSGASNASGLSAGNYPPTVGAVINLAAAQIASAPAFAERNAQ